MNTLLPGILNTGFYQMLDATGSGQMVWTIDSGRLPNGVTLSPSGLISGKPTESGPFNVTIRATNDVGFDVRAFAMSVFAGTSIVNPSLPFALTGTAYNATLEAHGEGPFTWAVTTGSLPNGLVLNTGTGVISGTATADGRSTFTITATGVLDSASASFTIDVYTLPQITTANLGHGVLTENFNVKLTATGTQPMTFTHTGGSLPYGVVLASDGTLSGTPTGTGNFTFTITVTNAGGSTSREYTVGVFQKPTLTFVSFDDAVVGILYTRTLTAIGSPTITYAVTEGQLPAGLNLNTATGVITGTPTTSELRTFTITATNAYGSDAKQYTIFVGQRPAFITDTLGFTIRGQQAEYQLEATGTAPITYAITGGELPPGLQLTTTGVIGGASSTDGEYTFNVTATNAYGFIEKQFKIFVFSRPVITTSPTLPNAVLGQDYNVQLRAAGTMGND